MPGGLVAGAGLPELCGCFQACASPAVRCSPDAVRPDARADGVDIAYQVAGTAGGLDLVFVPGWVPLFTGIVGSTQKAGRLGDKPEMTRARAARGARPG